MNYMEINLHDYLVVAICLFLMGLFGFFRFRANVIKILISVEIMMLSLSFMFVIFSLMLNDIVGQIFVLFIISIAAAHLALGLAISVLYFRNSRNKELAIESMNKLKG